MLPLVSSGSENDCEMQTEISIQARLAMLGVIQKVLNSKISHFANPLVTIEMFYNFERQGALIRRNTVSNILCMITDAKSKAFYIKLW